MLSLQDTLTGETRQFAPLAPDGVVRMYVCGVTPYSDAHVGHALHAIVFDVLRRYLEWRGFTVRHVQNFTDIDDKLIERSQSLGIPMAELAERNIEAYMAELKAMNVMPATEYPRVTDTVPAILEFIAGLIERGLAYASGGDVYFRVRAFGAERYGALSRRNVDDLLAGARVDASELKDDPLDFALWKAARPGEPAWDSPWGPGRPGWHIECSAMALKSLGPEIDIHGGGADLIFPHHTNEIAQSEGYTGARFARFWIHNALLQLGSEKMSKSVGNLVSIAEALERHGPDALRMFVISSHYRSPVTYTDEALTAAAAGARRLREAAFAECGVAPGTAAALQAEAGGERKFAGTWQEAFTEAMDNDLNTPQAVAVLFDIARAINRGRSTHDVRPAQAELKELAGILGFQLRAPSRSGAEAAPFIDLLVAVRAEARTAKQWALADLVRDRLRGLGVELQDSPEGTSWTTAP